MTYYFIFLRILRKKHASNFETNPSRKNIKQKHHSQKRIISTRGKAKKKNQCICIITNCRANVLHQFLNRHRFVPFFYFCSCVITCVHLFFTPIPFVTVLCWNKNFISFSFFTVRSISVCYVCAKRNKVIFFICEQLVRITFQLIQTVKYTSLSSILCQLCFLNVLFTLLPSLQCFFPCSAIYSRWIFVFGCCFKKFVGILRYIPFVAILYSIRTIFQSCFSSVIRV